MANLLLISAAVLLCGHVVTATSDPVADMCGPLCREFDNVRKQCRELRNCYNYMPDDFKTFIACAKPCDEQASICRKLCTTNFNSYFDQCRARQCVNSNNYNCVHDCFDRSFMADRDSQLTVPNPNIGPFQPTP